MMGALGTTNEKKVPVGTFFCGCGSLGRVTTYSESLLIRFDRYIAREALHRN
jgi:hypothetical protein